MVNKRSWDDEQRNYITYFSFSSYCKTKTLSWENAFARSYKVDCKGREAEGRVVKTGHKVITNQLSCQSAGVFKFQGHFVDNEDEKEGGATYHTRSKGSKIIL